MQISNKLQRVSEPLMGCINGTCKRWQDSVVVDHLPWTRSLRDNAQASPTYFNMIAPMRESHDTDDPLPCNAAGRLIKSIDRHRYPAKRHGGGTVLLDESRCTGRVFCRRSYPLERSIGYDLETFNRHREPKHRSAAPSVFDCLEGRTPVSRL